jgi:hypothetical protein
MRWKRNKNFDLFTKASVDKIREEVLDVIYLYYLHKHPIPIAIGTGCLNFSTDA